ncbi:hypothetical protein J4447_01425 [Candidatus Pacearchaeota archaeon]|nr:hypothetical protein [Candidatus Pacearchaeota archaeon]
MTYRNKDVIVRLSEEADGIFEDLKNIVSQEKLRGIESSFHQTLLRSILRARDLLKKDPFSGNQVPKRLIPPKYIKKYGVDNVWRIELSDRWRLLYTITGNQVEIITFIMDIVNHKDYDKIFGYKS